jgi:hypothetical protein
MKLSTKKTIVTFAVALLLTVPGALHASITFDDFNVNEGHFTSTPATGSGSTANVAGTSTADRVTTDSPIEGSGHQKLVLNATTAGNLMRLRHLSGGGSAANNTAFTTSAGVDGWIGVYIKTLDAAQDPNWTVQIWLEGASNNGSNQKTIIADGNWHLYEWNIDETGAGAVDGWGDVQSILAGSPTVANGSHTIDSIIFRNTTGPASTTFFMDFVAKSDSDSVSNLLSAPCLATSGVLVGGPLGTNSTQANVTAVDAAATAINVYQYSNSIPVLIGTKTTGIVAGQNAVTVSGLKKNSLVIATQVKNSQESCLDPTKGIYVGSGANPAVRVALSIRETSDTGPIGQPATTTSSGNIHFLGAANLSGGAPIDSPVITPSNNWQTVTFSRGDFVTVPDSANVVGETIVGTGYPDQTGASIQVFAYKVLTNNVRVYSSFPAESAFISSNTTFDIKWTWDAVPDAQGYRLLRNFNSAGYFEGRDVTGTNSFTDNNTGWLTNASALSVVPVTARSQPSVKWNTGSGDPIGTQNNIPTDWGILESVAFTINGGDTGPFDLYVDNIQNGSTVFQTFEEVPAGTLDYGFRQPSFSGTTGPGLLATPNVGVVTNVVADTGTNAFRVQWQWNGTNVSKWLRLTTSGAGAVANPLVDLSQPISFRLLLLPVGASLSGGSPTISYSLSGNQVILNWTGTFNLESKTNLNEASWTSVGVNTSPYTNTITGSAKFFRLHNP